MQCLAILWTGAMVARSAQKRFRYNERRTNVKNRRSQRLIWAATISTNERTNQTKTSSPSSRATTAKKLPQREKMRDRRGRRALPHANSQRRRVAPSRVQLGQRLRMSVIVWCSVCYQHHTSRQRRRFSLMSSRILCTRRHRNRQGVPRVSLGIQIC